MNGAQLCDYNGISRDFNVTIPHTPKLIIIQGHGKLRWVQFRVKPNDNTQPPLLSTLIHITQAVNYLLKHEIHQ